MIGHKIFHKKSCQNSFKWAKENLQEPCGSTFISDHIENARGRQGRSWQVKEGQLLVTILLKPNQIDPGELGCLGMALSIGFLEPLMRYGAVLKWPNDFEVEGKKVGGMMIECIWQGETLQGLLVGLGLNVNTLFDEGDPLHYIATSLAVVSGHKVDRKQLLADLLASADRQYEEWKGGQSEKIFTQWSSLQHYKGRTVSLHLEDGSLIHGKLVGFAPDGDALVDTGGSTVRVPFYIVENLV